MVQDSDAYDGHAILIPPSFSSHESCCLATNSPKLQLAPGNYTVTFRLKVPDNQETNPVARIYTGFLTNDWNEIATQTISPSDFRQPDAYQDFNLSFTIDTLISGFECRIDHWQGTQTELYVDYFRIIRSGGQALPLFTTILVPLIITPEEMPFQNTAPGRFTAAFEAAGGLVLNPDEFMAALNPEFMIEFTKPILGAAHPAIMAAQVQLAQGNYLGSLLTIRDALRPNVVAEIRVEPEHHDIESGRSDSVDVVINGVTGIGAFSFEMEYDSDIIRVDSVLMGSFLGSTGRPLSVHNPAIDNINGNLNFRGTTSGEDPGANGSGNLATILFTSKTEGSTSLTLKEVRINNADNLSLTVGSIISGRVSVYTPTGVFSGNLYPDQFTLWQNYPNPFNPATQISYAIPEASFLEIQVYNIFGQKIKTLISKYQTPGNHAVTWDGTDNSGKRVSSGIYYYRLTADNFNKTMKMTLIK